MNAPAWQVTLPIHLEGLGRKVQFSLALDNRRVHDQWLLRFHQDKQIYESEIVTLMLRVLREGDKAIDVGAHFGFMSLMMSRLVGDSGVVFAFEAEETACVELIVHRKRNDANNIVVAQALLGNKEGNADFWINTDDRSSSALWNPGLWRDNVRSRNEERVERFKMTTLDYTLASMTKCRLLKVDVEGAEERVLRGATKTLEKTDFVVVELNPFGMQQMGCSHDTLRDYMAGLGFEMFFLHRDGRFPTLIPRGLEIKYADDCVIKNVLFTTMDRLVEAWPESVE